jgi:Ni/Fe-hydrogenase 1 B-type cytochrome subunit
MHLIRQQVYGIVQRILHWWIACSVMALLVTGLLADNMEAGGQKAFTWHIHGLIGQILLVGFLGRLTWALIGPEHARIKSFFFFKEWANIIKTRRPVPADANFGHNPQAAVTYLGLYGLLFAMCGTGLILMSVRHGEGPFAEHFLDQFHESRIPHLVHEKGFWLIVIFISGHLSALIYHEIQEAIPMAQSMISGFQYRSAKGGVEKSNAQNQVKRAE